MERTAAAATAATLACLIWTGSIAAQTTPTLQARLTGTDSGDPDGAGTFTAEVDRQAGQICYELTVSGLAEATAAHIHRGGAGQSGRPVVGLDAPTAGSAHGCEPVAADLLAEIFEDPQSFYVNVHTAEFREGAVRGQLAAGR